MKLLVNCLTSEFKLASTLANTLASEFKLIFQGFFKPFSLKQFDPK